MKFTWNPDLYDIKHDFVSEYGLEILKLLYPQKDEVILDLGCGTGDLTGRIAATSHQRDHTYPNICRHRKGVMGVGE